MKLCEEMDGRMRVVAVPARYAGQVLRLLHARRLVDRTVKTSKRGRNVLIPIVSVPSFDVTPYHAEVTESAELPQRSSPRNPREELRARLEAAGIRPLDAPRRWQRIGDVVVIRLPAGGNGRAKKIAEIYGTVLRARTVVEQVSGIHGPLRTPDVRVLWGDGTETVHVEAGLRYALDVARVMFSSGNLTERTEIADRVRPGATVVDLFAGIGYFSLPIAVRGRARAVYACELNPISFRYLLENIRLNRATNVIPRLGNCRDVAPRGVADWVVMGHFDAREYLDVAFRALRGKGTIVYHELGPKEQYPDALTRRLAASARAHWKNVVSIRTRIVKSYAPGIVHSAAEMEVVPQSRGGSTETHF